MPVEEGILKGVELYVPPASRLWKEILGGRYDESLYEAVTALRDVSGAVIWDIGAHVGYHSFGFAALGAQVTAFEPNPANVERFKLHMARNPQLAKRIDLLEIAISDRDDHMMFRHSDDLRSASSGGHLERALPPLDRSEYAEFQITAVPTNRVDTLIEQDGKTPPDVLKIDVEGAEELVLRGATHLLREKRPILLIEIHHICLMMSIAELLRDAGYRMTLIDEQHASPSRCFVLATTT